MRYPICVYFQIKYVRQNSYDFPRISICLENWQNKNYMSEAKLNKNVTDYLDSIMSISGNSFFGESAEVDYQNAKKSFEEFVLEKNFTYYEEAFGMTSWSLRDISLDASSSTGKDETFKKKIFSVQLMKTCYEVIFPPQTATELTAHPINAYLAFNQPDAAKSSHLLVGSDVSFFERQELMNIKTGRSYVVHINAHMVNLFNRKDAPCIEKQEVDSTNYTYKECFRKCVAERQTRDGLMCRLFMKGDKIFDPTRNLDICTTFTTSRFKKVYKNGTIEIIDDPETAIQSSQKAQEICFSECRPRCENVYYDVTLIDETDKLVEGSNVTHLDFVLKYAWKGMMFLEETSTYSFQSAVSNIGGQLGLWMGLSIVTIFQAILFFVNKCFKGNNSAQKQ